MVWPVLGADHPTSAPLKKIRANGVELHYIDQGKGVPVVFVHGGLVDYRRWFDQVEPFAKKYRIRRLGVRHQILTATRFSWKGRRAA
jgi:hypothetical protein